MDPVPARTTHVESAVNHESPDKVQRYHQQAFAIFICRHTNEHLESKLISKALSSCIVICIVPISPSIFTSETLQLCNVSAFILYFAGNVPTCKLSPMQVPAIEKSAYLGNRHTYIPITQLSIRLYYLSYSLRYPFVIRILERTKAESCQP